MLVRELLWGRRARKPGRTTLCTGRSARATPCENETQRTERSRQPIENKSDRFLAEPESCQVIENKAFNF
jgi:hypothetical protein